MGEVADDSEGDDEAITFEMQITVVSEDFVVVGREEWRISKFVREVQVL